MLNHFRGGLQHDPAQQERRGATLTGGPRVTPGIAHVSDAIAIHDAPIPELGL